MDIFLRPKGQNVRQATFDHPMFVIMPPGQSDTLPIWRKFNSFMHMRSWASNGWPKSLIISFERELWLVKLTFFGLVVWTQCADNTYSEGELIHTYLTRVELEVTHGRRHDKEKEAICLYVAVKEGKNKEKTECRKKHMSSSKIKTIIPRKKVKEGCTARCRHGWRNNINPEIRGSMHEKKLYSGDTSLLCYQENLRSGSQSQNWVEEA